MFPTKDTHSVVFPAEIISGNLILREMWNTRFMFREMWSSVLPPFTTPQTSWLNKSISIHDVN